MNTQATENAITCEHCGADMFNGKCIADDDFEDCEVAEYERLRIQARIAATFATTKPLTNERNAALAGVKWRLQTRDEQYVALHDTRAYITSDPNHALVFDGRDSEQFKAAFYRALVVEFVYPVLI